MKTRCSQFCVQTAMTDLLLCLFFDIFQMGFPFWRIGTHTDLINLHHALDLGHL